MGFLVLPLPSACQVISDDYALVFLDFEFLFVKWKWGWDKHLEQSAVT